MGKFLRWGYEGVCIASLLLLVACTSASVVDSPSPTGNAPELVSNITMTTTPVATPPSHDELIGTWHNAENTQDIIEFKPNAEALFRYGDTIIFRYSWQRMDRTHITFAIGSPDSQGLKEQREISLQGDTLTMTLPDGTLAQYVRLGSNAETKPVEQPSAIPIPTNTPRPTNTPTLTPTPKPTSTQTPQPIGVSRKAPVPVGTPYATSSGVAILPLKVEQGPAVTKKIKAANMFNPEPKPGRKHVLVSVVVMNATSKEEPIRVSGSSFSIVGSSGKIINPAFAVLPTELDAELFPEGTAAGEILFEVPKDENDMVLIYQTSIFGGQRFYFALPE